MFGFFRNRRRKKWLAQREPSSWEGILHENVWQYHHLNAEQVRRVHEFVCVLFHEKVWSGGRDLEISDEMRVTIAGQAALLTLGFGKPYYFDRLRSIIVYPKPYHSQPASSDDLLLGQLGQPVTDFGVRFGESWQGGPIVLAWNVVLKEGQSPGEGRNLVVHEFAHHMDGLNGQTDGAPPITDYEFEKLLELARRGESTLLDHYGAENHAEFFAVATECFFTRPHALSHEHADLFAVLKRLFGQDPRQWIPGNSSF